MLLLTLALDQQVVTDDKGRPVAALTWDTADRPCDSYGPTGSPPGWVEGDWVLLSETPGGLVLCREGQRVHIAWRVPPDRKSKALVAEALGPPTVEVSSTHHVDSDIYIQFHMGAYGGLWQERGVYDGGAFLEGKGVAGRNERLGFNLAGWVGGSWPLGGGAHVEMLIGPTRWMTPRLALRGVVGPSIEGLSGGTLPWALQAPVEVGFLLDPHRNLRLDAHARAAANLAVDPVRRGLPHRDYSVGLDLFMGPRNGGATPMFILGSEVRWTMEDRRIGFTIGVGAAD